MPHLHGRPFDRKKPPLNIHPNHKVFFCDVSNEVFTNYEEFWERLVLLNALVWSCKFTGRPNLTFREALDCEAKAKKCLINIPVVIKKPILYFTILTKRGRLADLVEDVFGYIKDRYFLEEKVEAIVKKHWYDCKVTHITHPSIEEIKKYMEASDGEEDDDGSKKNCDSDDDIFVVRDDHAINKSATDLADISEDCEDGCPPYATVKYEVEELEPWDYKESKRHVVSWDQIRRMKSSLTKEKCKLYLKHCVHLDRSGFYTVDDKLVRKYKLDKLNYCDIFVGKVPVFQHTIAKKLPIHPEKRKRNKKLLKSESSPVNPKGKKDEGKSPANIKGRKEDGKNSLSSKGKKEDSKNVIHYVEVNKKPPVKTKEQREEEKEKLKEEMKLKLEVIKAERKKEKDLQREEKWLMDLCEAEYNTPREDLHCGDHKDLPLPTKVDCRIPDDTFGDFLLILEFVNIFAELLELKDVYPQGVTFDMLEHAIVEKEIAGIFNDILQLLLGAIFSLQEEEEEEIHQDNTLDTGEIDLEIHLESKDQKAAIAVANKASTWCQQYHGTSLQKAPLDALTLTEILRLHLLSSGATNVTNAYWRMLNRGGYRSTDDPCLQFKVDEPGILKKLSVSSVFDLAVGEKAKILNVLASQIITYASVRDSIDDKIDKLRELKYKLRLHRFAEIRKEREEKSLQRQKLKEEKLKISSKKVENEKNPQEKEKESETPTEKVDENDNEEDEDEITAREEKEERLKERKKQESSKKEKTMTDQIQNLTQGVCQLPLGRDRTHRRYWLLNSIPAVLVEECVQNLGPCFEKTVFKEIPPEENLELKAKIKVQAVKNLSLKEKDELASIEKKKLQDSEPGKEADEIKESISDDENEYSFNIESLMSTADANCSMEAPLQSNLCSTDPSTCSIHSLKLDKPKWFFYHRESDMDQLIESLNKRGIRENELKENLIQHKNAVKEAIKNCPAYKLDPSQEPDLAMVQRKSLRGSVAQSTSSNLNFPPNTPVCKILEFTLRDMILEVEEKLDSGYLGKLKIDDRDAWRQAVVDGSSKPFLNIQEIEWGGKKRLLELKSSFGIEIKEEEDPVDLLAESKGVETESIKELTLAILLIGQALDPKYLRAPLMESDKVHRQRTTLLNKFRKFSKKEPRGDCPEVSSDDDDDNFDEKVKKMKSISDNSLRTPYERWEKSLMASTSFSQLFLHLAILDNSITWSRSALNARCCLCRRKSDPEKMLLCDECDKGHHIYCLKPKLKAIPLGDWFCERCKPKEKVKTPRKKRRMYSEESDDESQPNNLSDAKDPPEESEEENMEYCAACEMGGELICCDTCPRSFHTDCADLRKIPRGTWSCPLCKDEVPLKTRGTKRPFDEMDDGLFQKSAVETLINDLTSHKDSWPFVKPVFKVDCPDYYTKIKKPMDFRTMKNRLNKNKYTSDSEFVADVLLIFQNCQQYYKESAAEYVAANKLSKFFWARVEKLSIHTKEKGKNSAKKKKIG